MRAFLIVTFASVGLLACGAAPQPAPVGGVNAGDVKVGPSKPGEPGCMVCGLTPAFASEALTNVTLSIQLSDEAQDYSYVGGVVHVQPAGGTAYSVEVGADAFYDGKVDVDIDDLGTELQDQSEWAGAEAWIEAEYKTDSGTDFQKWSLDIAK